MSSTGDCSAAVGSWYWIYWIGPFVASWLVAEVTDLMEWNVDEGENLIATKMTEEVKSLDIDALDDVAAAPSASVERQTSSSSMGEGAC